jgi:undecaprenyl diphosphate synthase
MRLPTHLAIIMDGNGRWAEQRGKSRSHGHIKGTRVAKTIIQECSRKGIKYLTLYAFSTENWLRPKSEVSILMKILKKYLKKETSNLIKENIRFETIGDRTQLPSDVAEAIDHSQKATAQCTGMKLIFALSYGSRQEITSAIRDMAELVEKGLLRSQDISAETVSAFLQTRETPDPDLILRTSGEKRLSNFLLWQAAYSEFCFSAKLWPEFTKEDLTLVLQDYGLRERRFGQVKSMENHEQLTH